MAHVKFSLFQPVGFLFASRSGTEANDVRAIRVSSEVSARPKKIAGHIRQTQSTELPKRLTFLCSGTPQLPDFLLLDSKHREALPRLELMFAGRKQHERIGLK
jgi:hypothetical protein